MLKFPFEGIELLHIRMLNNIPITNHELLKLFSPAYKEKKNFKQGAAPDLHSATKEFKFEIFKAKKKTTK